MRHQEYGRVPTEDDDAGQDGNEAANESPNNRSSSVAADFVPGLTELDEASRDQATAATATDAIHATAPDSGSGTGPGLRIATAPDGADYHERRQDPSPWPAGPPRPQPQPESETEAKSEPRPPAVAWRDLPSKLQLLIITLARLSEPLVQTSLQSYMFYQLKWFDPSLPDAVIASQAGVLHASFTAAQFVTALLWGRVADSPRFGRKTVLLVGLSGTCASCLGFGFATTFAQALCFRLLGGITNGNVGVMRTMISEIVREKRFQSRAFLILPMTFNIGVIVGPILGGILSDPAGSYPDLFGDVPFFQKYPYATPNLVSALFLFSGVLAVWFGLEETLDALRDNGPDLGSRVGHKLAIFIRGAWSRLRRTRDKAGYRPLHNRGGSTATDVTDATDATDTSLELDDEPESPTRARGSRPVTGPGICDGDDDDDDPESKPSPPGLDGNGTSRDVTGNGNGGGRGAKHRPGPRYSQRLPFRRLFTRNVLMTFASHFLLAFHVGTFNSLWFVFLSTPVYDPSADTDPRHHPSLPFRFTGGLGLPPRSVGLAMAILGFIGITLQLVLYPMLSARLGTLTSFRVFLLAFPLAYTLAPYLAVVPSSASAPPPDPKAGFPVWAAITLVLFLQVCGRTFALPGQTILVNNCTPHPSVLGTVHGLGQSVSSAARTIGPMLGGWLYGLGLVHGVVGGVWWGMAAVAVVGAIASWFVRDGDGHEICLPGDELDEDLLADHEHEHRSLGDEEEPDPRRERYST